MPPDCHVILGLDPRRVGPGEVREQFARRRRELIARLHQPDVGGASRAQLDDLHLAYRRYLSQREQPLVELAKVPAPALALRRFIESCQEGGLLRPSRRHKILAEGRRLGFSHFQTQLLIAMTLMGDRSEPLPATEEDLVTQRLVDSQTQDANSLVARLAAVALLALAMLLAAVRWLS